MIQRLLFSLSIIFLLNTHAIEVEGVKVPDRIKVANKELVLNGSGVRHATFLNVNVYVGSLYLLNKTTDVKKVLNLPYPKQVSMNFIRDVTKDELIGAWKEGFEAAVSKEERASLSQVFKTFLEKMDAMKKNDAIYLRFLKEGVEYTIKGKNFGPIGGSDFSRALLSIWFINARDEGLRDGMLGKN